MGKLIQLGFPAVADDIDGAEAVWHYMNKVRDQLIKEVAR